MSSNNIFKLLQPRWPTDEEVSVTSHEILLKSSDIEDLPENVLILAV